MQLGGDAVYFGKRVEKAALGDAKHSIEAADLTRTVRLMNLASLLALGLGVLARFVVFL